jgi:hypothetical protein
MTKDLYFEMCAALGTEPVESEIPVELDDFVYLVQQCIQIYYVLPDMWDPMGGNYLGKDYSLVFKLLKLYLISKSENLLALEFLQYTDSVRSKLIAEKQKQKSPQK